MNVDKRVLGILEAAQEGVAPNRDECVFLLQFPETSLEAALLRAVADASTRRRFNNSGILFGQIGVDIAACPGKCKFCAFGEGHTTFEPSVMSDEEILHGVDDFTNTGELYALFLMTMHTFDFERLTRIVQKALERIPRHTQLVVNIGDLDAAQVRDLKAAGVSGAYHVCRLREGAIPHSIPSSARRRSASSRRPGWTGTIVANPSGQSIARRSWRTRFSSGSSTDAFSMPPCGACTCRRRHWLLAARFQNFGLRR